MTETSRREINEYLKTLSLSYPMDEQEEKKVDLKFQNQIEDICLYLNGAYFVASCRHKGGLENVSGLNLYEKEAELQSCFDFPSFVMEEGDIERKNHFFLGFGVGNKND